MMTKFHWVLDPLILGGALSSLFFGLINPFYVSLILGDLSARVISVGSFLSSGLPFVAGLLLENKELYKRLYAVLPLVMLFEVVCAVFVAFLCRYGIATYYIAGMVVFGLFSTTILYLMQRLKEKRYAKGRATFERRYGMADALGYLVGSLLVFLEVVVIKRLPVLLALTVVQTAVVYGVYLISYRKVPA